MLRSAPYQSDLISPPGIKTEVAINGIAEWSCIQLAQYCLLLFCLRVSACEYLETLTRHEKLFLALLLALFSFTI